MPGMDDFYAFKSTSSGSSGSSGKGGGSVFLWILIVIAILELIGKIFG